MRAMTRRLARLEVASREQEELLVSPETLQRMAEIYEDSCARAREKLLGGGPHIPVVHRDEVDSPARRILREKLLRDDPAA